VYILSSIFFSHFCLLLLHIELGSLICFYINSTTTKNLQDDFAPAKCQTDGATHWTRRCLLKKGRKCLTSTRTDFGNPSVTIALQTKKNPPNKKDRQPTSRSPSLGQRPEFLSGILILCFRFRGYRNVPNQQDPFVCKMQIDRYNMLALPSSQTNTPYAAVLVHYPVQTFLQNTRRAQSGV
jgi:hypothetical protein